VPDSTENFIPTESEVIQDQGSPLSNTLDYPSLGGGETIIHHSEEEAPANDSDKGQGDNGGTPPEEKPLSFLEQVNQMTGGTYEKVEDFKSAWTDVNGRVSQFEQEKQNWEKNRYQSDFGKQIDAFAASGLPEEKMKMFLGYYANGGIDNSDPYQVVAKSLVSDKDLPMIDTIEKGMTFLKKKYPTNVEAYKDGDGEWKEGWDEQKANEDIVDAAMEFKELIQPLKTEYDQAIENIKGYSVQKGPDPLTLQAVESNWKTPLSTSVSGIKDVYNLELEGIGELKYELPQNHQKAWYDTAMNYLVANQKNVNQENLNEALNVAQQTYFLQNFKQIMTAAAKHAYNLGLKGKALDTASSQGKPTPDAIIESKGAVVSTSGKGNRRNFKKNRTLADYQK